MNPDANIPGREARRQAEQARLDRARPAAERNRLGQFATPPGLARQIVAHVRALRGPWDDPIRFLDPTVGTGAFYSALSHVTAGKAIESAIGVEVDPAVASVARSLWGEAGLTVLEGSFFDLTPTGPKANLVLANPPYVRHHHISRDEKVRLGRRVAGELGLAVSGLAGLYCYVLLCADAWMADGGLAAWLIPSEFLDVNYGEVLRRYLSERVTLLQIHRADPADLQFGDALVTSAVVIFARVPPPEGHRVRLSLGGELARPDRTEDVPLEALRAAPRWSGFFSGRVAATQGPTLGDLFDIRRGVATGCNRFFIRPREEFLERGIPDAFLKPILPGARVLGSEVIGSDPDGYPRLPRPLALIDCDLPGSTLEREHPRFWAYLQVGREQGVADGYLASRRRPWYSQERREPAPFLCNYMGRPGKDSRPFTFYWNQSRAIAPNVYLMLYPKGPLRERLADPEVPGRIFQRLQALRPDDLTGQGRVYGGGLHKVEPNELKRIRVDEFV